MSTGLECHFYGLPNGEWYYLLQDADCPAQAWDWREHATAFGPLASLEAARAHLDRYHANPGGSSRVVSSAGWEQDRSNEVLVRTFAGARLTRWPDYSAQATIRLW